MKLRIRDQKATVLKKETAWKSDHKWQSYRRRREHEQNWLFVTMSIKDEEESLEVGRDSEVAAAIDYNLDL